MPLGLWKSKVEILCGEMIRRHVTLREMIIRRDSEFRAERAAAESRWRERYAAQMARVDENHRETLAALRTVTDDLRELRLEVRRRRDA
ncbi:MAG TPA: hypothetical protein VJL81_17240 [Solirubrobacterales bacterium]|nr:hypothetical protein [Solirubrobacterales bacterium]